MSSDTPAPVIVARQLSKCYHMYANPRDRLKQMLWRGRRRYYQEFWALRDLSFEVYPGEVLGIVGRNGAGKSTLLQLVCGTLFPTSGSMEVRGRVAALLELGAGFNPEFTGRENVLMSAAIMGLSREEIAARYDEIVAFADIGAFIEHPVKTYSSGMYMRLAFAVATSVEPDILVIDEALSVGDGEFARRSFDRIMALKDAGRTILFCSHSTYQVEVLCRRALWLENGRLRLLAEAERVTGEYNTSLALAGTQGTDPALPSMFETEKDDADAGSTVTAGRDSAGSPSPSCVVPGSGRITRVWGECDGVGGSRLAVRSQESELAVTVEFILDPVLPPPTVALGFETAAGIVASSVIVHGVAGAAVKAAGRGGVTFSFPQLPLLKGEYRLTAFLACEQGLHVYDTVPACLTLEVSQKGALQGLVALPFHWRETVVNEGEKKFDQPG